MTHWLHYHAKAGVEERRRKHPRMPFDRISTSKALPSDLKIGDTIWGFTRIEKEYYLMGSLVVQWFGNTEDVPENVTSESLFNHKKYAATCPTTEATPYKKVFIDEMPYCELPSKPTPNSLAFSYRWTKHRLKNNSLDGIKRSRVS